MDIASYSFDLNPYFTNTPDKGVEYSEAQFNPNKQNLWYIRSNIDDLNIILTSEV